MFLWFSFFDSQFITYANRFGIVLILQKNFHISKCYVGKSSPIFLCKYVLHEGECRFSIEEPFRSVLYCQIYFSLFNSDAHNHIMPVQWIVITVLYTLDVNVSSTVLIEAFS